MIAIIGIIFLLAQFSLGLEEDIWDYTSARGTLDPKHWYMNYEVCKGNRQSPVNIDCSHIRADRKLQPLQFKNYDRPVRGLLMHNDGHTIKIDVPATAGLKLISSSLPAPYRLSQFHFHWGTARQGGSEHTVNEKRWPLEMHLVHVDENIPASQTTLNKNGMVVVSVLFDITIHQPNPAFETLTKSIPKVVNEGENVTLPEFVISHLLPEKHTSNYLRYSGSLTTPPCAEVVEWHILTRTMSVTPIQLSRFRSTRQRIHSLKINLNAKEVQIQENDRPLQPLNDRPIRLMGDLGPSFPKCPLGKKIAF